MNGIINRFDSKKNIKTLKDILKDLSINFKKYFSKDQLKSLIEEIVTKIYGRDIDNIVDETWTILEMIRVFTMLTTATAISPLLTIPAFIVDQAIRSKIEEKNCRKMYIELRKELEKVNTKLDSSKLTKEETDNLIEYKKEMEKAIYKLEEYNENLNTYRISQVDIVNELYENDIEVFGEYELMYESINKNNIDINKNMEKFGITDLHNTNNLNSYDRSRFLINSIISDDNIDKFVNLYMVNSIDTVSNIIEAKEEEYINKRGSDVMNYTHISESLLGEMISSVALIDTKFEDGDRPYNKDDIDYLLELLTDEDLYVAESLSPKKYQELLDSIPSIDCMKANTAIFAEAIMKLSDMSYSYRSIPSKMAYDVLDNDNIIGVLYLNLNGDTSEFIFNNSKQAYTIFDINNNYTNRLNESTIETIESNILPYYELFIAEGSTTIKAKKATRKVRQADKKLSDKVDKTVDAVIANLKAIFAGDKREEIIKGVPRASRLIKLMLANIVVFGINAPLGVLSMMVTYSLSKKATVKERKKILNELKEELMITKEKIKMAERKNDDKAFLKLKRFERALERDIERIRYKTKKND